MNRISHDPHRLTTEYVFNRLEALERKNRHLWRLGIFTFFCSVTFLSIGLCEMFGMNIIPRKAVYAQSFRVQDARGVVRAQLSTDADSTLLTLYDKSGFHRIALSVYNNESAVHVYDNRGMRRGVFGLAKQGPSLVFMNPNGVEQSGLMTRKDGATELILRDADQNPVISFGACPTFPEAFHYLAAGIQTWQRLESGQPAFSILERHPAGLN